MSTLVRRRPRGFTLIELMIASAVLLMVFAGASWAAVQLHRRGNLEEQVADLQETARAVRELLSPRLERAGAGISNLTLTVGAAGGLPDIRTSVDVQTAAVVPPAPYASSISDTMDLYWADSPRIGLDSTGPCGAGTPRTGSDICVLRLPTAPVIAAGDFILVANPNPAIATSCLYQVTGTTGLPGAVGKFTIAPGLFADGAPVATSPCPTPGGPFWTSGDAYAVKMGGTSFRIDWTGPGGIPRLQYDPDGWWNPVTTWLTVADNVERLNVRIGLLSRNLLNPLPPLPAVAPAFPPQVVWFPEPMALPTPRPALDACLIATGSCQLNGTNTDPNLPDNLDAVDLQLATVMGGASPNAILRTQLMRRARMAELNVTVRSARLDPALIRMIGPSFIPDGAGNPQDGRTRRHYEVRLSLRNYGYAGI